MQQYDRDLFLLHKSRDHHSLYHQIGVFIFSAIVISIILRSSTGIRSTCYHRIILSLSASDSLVSLAIALTTIPMPREVIYPFEMPSYGNVETCIVQGISYITGKAVMVIMNCSLCLLLSMHNEVQDEGANFPMLFGISLVCSINSNLAYFADYTKQRRFDKSKPD